MTAHQKLDALVKETIDKGKVLETFGDYDPKLDEGELVSLVENGDLWIVSEKYDGDDNYLLFSDEADARESFSEIKEDIEEEAR